MENKSGEETWSLGERLLVRFKGIFYAARITKMALNKDGRVVFTVHYEGWNEFFDEKISAESAKRRFKKRQGEFYDDPTNNLFVVEAIRAVRCSERTETLEFLVRWKNYDEEDDSWEPEALLRETPEVAEMLEKFLAKNPPAEVRDNTKGAAEKEKLVNSKSSGEKQSIPKKPMKRSRPGPPPDSSTSVSLFQSPPKKYVKMFVEGEDELFCIVPFLQMNGQAEGGLIQNRDAPSSSGFGTSIARPFIVEASKQRVNKSTEIGEDSAKEFMAMWNEFLLKERTTNLGQDFLYPALEKFIDSLIDRMKTDSSFALCSQLFTLLSALVTARAISNDERFALFARIDPEGAKGLMNVVPPPEEEKGKRGRPRKTGSKKKGKKSIGGEMKKKNCSSSEHSPPVKFFPTLAESARRRNQPETEEKGEENEEPSSSQCSKNDN